MGDRALTASFTATARPSAPEPIPYLAPLPDYNRINFLTQGTAAPGVRKLRMGLNRALQEATRAENPNVAGKMRGEALTGYGGGLESIYGGARRGAMELYAPEYAATAEQERLNWEAKNKQGLLDYSASLSDYSKTPTGTGVEGSVRPSGGVRPSSNLYGGDILKELGYGGNVLSWGGGGGQPSGGGYQSSPMTYEQFASGWFNR